MSFPYTPCIPMQIKPIKACQSKGQGTVPSREWPCCPFPSPGLGSPCEFVSATMPQTLRAGVLVSPTQLHTCEVQEQTKLTYPNRIRRLAVFPRWRRVGWQALGPTQGHSGALATSQLSIFVVSAQERSVFKNPLRCKLGIRGLL